MERVTDHEQLYAQAGDGSPSIVPRKRSGGEHCFYYPKRKAPPKSAFGVSFLRCDVTFSTPHHITHEKPKPPAIEEKYPHTFLFVMLGLALNSEPSAHRAQGRLGARTSLPRH